MKQNRNECGATTKNWADPTERAVDSRSTAWVTSAAINSVSPAPAAHPIRRRRARSSMDEPQTLSEPPATRAPDYPRYKL